MELDALKKERFELENQMTRIDTQIAASKDKNERLRLMNKTKTLKNKLHNVANAIARIERANALKAQQEQRDAIANRQNNNTGRTRNRQRDIY
jgi:hypothetical protein